MKFTLKIHFTTKTVNNSIKSLIYLIKEIVFKNILGQVENSQKICYTINVKRINILLICKGLEKTYILKEIG